MTNQQPTIRVTRVDLDDQQAPATIHLTLNQAATIGLDNAVPSIYVDGPFDGTWWTVDLPAAKAARIVQWARGVTGTDPAQPLAHAVNGSLGVVFDSFTTRVETTP